MTTDRLNRLYTLMSAHGLDVLALNPGPTLTYLTGLEFHLMERPVVLLLSPGTSPMMVLPELEQAKIPQSRITLEPFPYGENPAGWGAVFARAAQAARLDGRIIGVEPTLLRFLEFQYLQAAAPQARLVSGAQPLAQLRLQKSPAEVACMRRAVQIAENALGATLRLIRIGMTEREIAGELTLQLLRSGSDSAFPFKPIVSGGPNGANPHASPGDRPIQSGDLLVIDWGAAHDGYISDLTRTFAVGDVDEECRRICEIVRQANAAGRAAGRPGLPAGQVDEITRAVIDQAGYGAYFIHRTGHGIGMEGHEAPYIYGENDLLLAEGMAYTVEPGIYLPDRNGVRIEDNVIITAGGCETLSTLPRELITIG
ncbi:MAG TPA: Xaa-Pro peptidase family protein [Anaerolineaceae bacterium]|nr:Xaa-Pro peptidase family protein [Anaerolineaceae bacterium]